MQKNHSKANPEEALSHPSAVREQRMLRRIFCVSLVFMIAAPIFVGWILTGLSVYIDNDVLVYAPSTMLTAASYVLSYLISLFSCLYQYAGFGVLGYSVMRYGVKKSAVPIVLSLVCVLITYAGNIGVLFYIYGKAAIFDNLGYFLPIWALNLFLAVFTCFCVIFLCALIRTAFRRKGRLAVSVSKEERETRKHNALRRLYLWITLLLVFFNFVSAALGTYAELRQVGAPETVWEWYTLLEPYFGLILYSVIGYFTMLAAGKYLTDADRMIADRISAERFSAQNDAQQKELLQKEL